MMKCALQWNFFLGNVAYLQDKCDYVLNIRMDNTGVKEQGCTNYISTYALINNIFYKKLLILL